MALKKLTEIIYGIAVGWRRLRLSHTTRHLLLNRQGDLGESFSSECTVISDVTDRSLRLADQKYQPLTGHVRIAS